MPIPQILSGYRIGAGTLTAAALDETFAIELLTNQDDRRQASWRRPQSRADIILPAAQDGALDGSLANYGGDVVVWEFAWLSPKMMDFFKTDFLGGNESAEMTIRTQSRMESREFKTFNCTAQWPAPDVIAGLRNSGTGLAEFPIKFILCRDAAES